VFQRGAFSRIAVPPEVYQVRNKNTCAIVPFLEPSSRTWDVFSSSNEKFCVALFLLVIIIITVHVTRRVSFEPGVTEPYDLDLPVFTNRQQFARGKTLSLFQKRYRQQFVTESYNFLVPQKLGPFFCLKVKTEDEDGIGNLRCTR